MNREIQVYQIANEYSRILGIPTPEMRVKGGILKTGEYSLGRYLGRCHEDYIQVAIDGRSLIDIRDTIAHELIHKAFPNLPHGKRFQTYIKGLKSGHLFFRGKQVLFGEERKDGMGRTYWLRGSTIWFIKPQTKFTILDLNMPKEPLPIDTRILKAKEHIKQINSRISRLETFRTKWLRRLRGLERNQK